MSMTHLRSTLAIPVLLLLGAAVALAQPRAGGPAGDGPGFDRQRQQALVRFLELTSEQLEQWRALQEAHRDALGTAFEEQRALMEELQAALSTSTPDPAAVGAIVIAQHAGRQALATAHAELEADLTALLNADQLLRYQAFQAAAQALGGRGRDHRGGRGR